MATAQQSSDANAVNNGSVSPSMAVIVIVLVFAFFITGSISIYIQQCVQSSTISAAPIFIAGADDARSTTGIFRGLDKSAIDTFPTFMYSAVKELKLGKGSLECAVCLNEFENDETLRLLPKCDHVFHPHCIDAWLAYHSTCPVCRANLVPEAADSIHRLDSDSEMEAIASDEGHNNQRCQDQITIHDEGATSKENDPKRNPKGKLPRSHSTGHALSGPAGEDVERYTLRLPAEVRRQLMTRTRLKRATSLVALPRTSSSQRGYRSGDEEGSGSSRYGRLFGRFLLTRVGSVKSSTKMADDGEATGGSVNSKVFLGTAVTPLESSCHLPV